MQSDASSKRILRLAITASVYSSREDAFNCAFKKHPAEEWRWRLIRRINRKLQLRSLLRRNLFMVDDDPPSNPPWLAVLVFGQADGSSRLVDLQEVLSQSSGCRGAVNPNLAV